MIVVLLGAGIPLPSRATELAQPVRRGAASWSRVAPDVKLAHWTIARAPRSSEPGVLIRCVVGNIVEDELQPEAMHIGHQSIEVLQRTEARIDIAIVGNVIAKVRHG